MKHQRVVDKGAKESAPILQPESQFTRRMSGDTIVGVLRDLWKRYQEDTPQKLKLVDAYLGYIMVTGIVQFLYCCLVGTFPFNSFLSGFISTVGCFVLGGLISVHLKF